MSKRILVVNPNTSTEVTEAYLAAARAIAPSDTIFTGVTGQFGAQIVSTPAENLIAGHSALELVAEHASGHDAVILAISFDTGLEALRSVLSVPVIGITEAALKQAVSQGGPVGVIFFGEVSRGLYEAVLARNGIVPMGMAAIEVGGASDYLSPAAKDDAVLAACGRLAEQGAKAIVICGAAIVGMAARVGARAPVPVYDGIEAVNVCISGRATGAATSRPRPLGDGVGLSPAQTRLLYGKTQ